MEFLSSILKLTGTKFLFPLIVFLVFAAACTSEGNYNPALLQKMNFK